MHEIAPITLYTATEAAPETTSAPARTSSFGDMVMSGLDTLQAQTDASAQALAGYAVGDTVSPHELMITMEQARLSMQLAVEVRNRLVDAYQELARMQI